MSEIDSEILRIKYNIEINLQKFNELDRLLHKIADMDERYEKLREHGDLSGYIQIQQNKLERLQKQKNKDNNDKIIGKLKSDKEYINKKTGPRKIPPATMRYLEKTVMTMGYDVKDECRIINEIVNEVRFGSLVTSNKTKEELPIGYAVNIALKLLKEQRWHPLAKQ